MTDQTNTTGTSEQETGDALEKTGTTETPAAEGRDGESREPDWKKMYLEAKDKIEEANQIKAKLAEAEASPPMPAAREEDDAEAEIVRLNQELAAKGDPAARLALMERERRLALTRELVVDRQLSRLPEDEAKEVFAHIQKNPGRFGDVQAARNDLRAQRMDDELKRLREENERLKRGPDPEVAKAPPTVGREFSARETKAREMSYDDYDSERANLSPMEALRRSAEVAEGKIRFRK